MVTEDPREQLCLERFKPSGYNDVGGYDSDALATYFLRVMDITKGLG